MTLNLKKIGDMIRQARLDRGVRTLDELAERITYYGREKPSLAKLSRIESGIQAVPIDILPPLAAITGLPARKLRPDLAAMLEAAE